MFWTSKKDKAIIEALKGVKTALEMEKSRLKKENEQLKKDNVQLRIELKNLSNDQSESNLNIVNQKKEKLVRSMQDTRLRRDGYSTQPQTSDDGSMLTALAVASILTDTDNKIRNEGPSYDSSSSSSSSYDSSSSSSSSDSGSSSGGSCGGD